MTRSTVARRNHAAQTQHDREIAAARQRRRRSWALWAAGLIAVASVVAYALLSSQPQQTAEVRPAPLFTLTDTSGSEVSLADYRGRNVILFFSEGAGCQSCLVQMAEIEKKEADFADANIVVLPIVMNSREQIVADMAANRVTTPFLLDDGTVSTAYDTIGKGMHAGLPGHSFVVIDAAGRQRWYGEYPSMWLDPDALLAQAKSVLDL